MIKKILSYVEIATLLVAAVLVFSACSGGGGSSSTTLSGTAAAGAPIVGTVTIKDSTTPTAITKTVDIQADGKYTVDVKDLKAPYMVRADGYVGGNEYHLYSAGTSADVGGTINVTPLTDLIVANIAGTVAKTYFDNGAFSNLTATQIETQSNALKAKLLPILQSAGVSDSIDLLRASFSTDHTGLDAALDILKVSTDSNTGIVTIKNIITQQQMTSNVATATYTGALTDTTGVQDGITDIKLISDGFKAFSGLFANGVPSETNATLLSLFDKATFLQSGESLAAFLSKITTEKNIVGLSFTNINIISMDKVSGIAKVGFNVIQNGKISNDAPEAWFMIKKAGKWYMQGDQRIADVSIKSRAEYRPSDINQPISTGLQLDIEDRGGKGITSAVVTGKGLAGPVTLINNINNEWFEIQGNYGGNLYSMTDKQISEISDAGEVYTVQLYSGTQLKATYTEKLKKRPYKISELTAASFPSVTSPTMDQLRSFAGGTGTVTWTLPAGLTNDWLSIGISDNVGNSARAEYSLVPSDRSKSVTLDSKTSTGQAFIPTNRWIWLGAWDSFGRELAVSIW